MTGSHLGLDVGGSEIKWSTIADGDVVGSGRVSTPRSGGETLIDELVRLIEEKRDALDGVGLAFPATIDTVRRRTLLVPNIPGEWNHYPVADVLERRVGLPVALVNDARAFATAELLAGSATGEQRVLFATLGTGIGGAIALDGRILIGDQDSIGEVGHIPVETDGELCMCGGRGCLETVASASAIVGRLGRSVAMGQSPILAELCTRNGGVLTARTAAEAALAGDAWAIDAFDRAGRALGTGLGTACLLLRIPTIVIGGGLASALPLLLPAMQAVLDARTSINGQVEVRAGAFGTEAGAVGAALFAAASGTAVAAASDPHDSGSPDGRNRP